MHLVISLFSYILITLISIKMASGKRKMTVGAVISIALLFTIYNVIVTAMSTGLGGDRLNYYVDCIGVRPAGSTGLMIVISLLRKITAHYEILFYFSTFVCMILTLTAYRISGIKSANALFFLLTTQYVLFTLTGIKQCYTNGFACLCLIIALQRKTKKDDILCILLIILAILFHPTGYLLIPLYLMVLIRKTTGLIILSFLLMLIVAFYMDTILEQCALFLKPFAPALSTSISRYVGSTALESLQTEGIMTVFKGVPFFIITILGIRRRPRLKRVIEGYDSYLLLSAALSLVYLITIYNSWFYRMAYLLYLPVGIFFVRLMSHEKNRNNYIILNAAVIGINAVLTLRFLALIYLNYGGF